MKHINYILLASYLLLLANLLAQSTTNPTYVGEQICRDCHHMQGNRNQHNQWQSSKHSQAYAVLYKKESKEIAELSGIDIEPYESPICLGCHTTAYNVEEWERDDTFRIQDGVQCELCHGPGSDYIDADIMKNREAAARAGLVFLQERDCMICHKEKNSHVTVLDSKLFDYDLALQEIHIMDGVAH